MKDLSDRGDIEKLIRYFYSHLLLLPEMKPSFEGLNFEEHIPRIINFWSFVLFDEEGYKTNVFDKHRHLPIQPAHFDLWLKTWTDSVDALYSGEKADLAKQRATVLAYTFKSKWEQLKK